MGAEVIPAGICQCGCGQPVTIRRGQPNRYLPGHRWARQGGARGDIYSAAGVLTAKTCTKCGKVKKVGDPGEFGRNSAAKDGLRNQCRDCKRAYDREALKDPERYARVVAAVRRWNAANPGKVQERVRRWQAANPEKVRANYRRRYQRNREELARVASLAPYDVPGLPEGVPA